MSVFMTQRIVIFLITGLITLEPEYVFVSRRILLEKLGSQINFSTKNWVYGNFIILIVIMWVYKLSQNISKYTYVSYCMSIISQ